jgi:hypothetical protein
MLTDPGSQFHLANPKLGYPLFDHLTNTRY